MPQFSVDPVVVPEMTVVRRQGIVSREAAPGKCAVLAVARSAADTKRTTIADHTVRQLTIRAGSDSTHFVDRGDCARCKG